MGDARLDLARMSQAQTKLLYNVRRHATGAERLLLRARRDSDTLVITVENDGAGHHADVLPRIFEPVSTGGSDIGLGLAIVRRIVETHTAA